MNGSDLTTRSRYTEEAKCRGVYGPLPVMTCLQAGRPRGQALPWSRDNNTYPIQQYNVLQDMSKSLTLSSSIILICTNILKTGRPSGSPLQDSLARGTVGVRLSSPRLAPPLLPSQWLAVIIRMRPSDVSFFHDSSTYKSGREPCLIFIVLKACRPAGCWASTQVRLLLLSNCRARGGWARRCPTLPTTDWLLNK